MFEKCPNLIKLSKHEQKSRIDFQIKSKMTRKPIKENKIGQVKPKKRLSRSFSDVKKDVKSLELVTYDINENKRYAYLINFINIVICDPSRMKYMNSHVLPIRTPASKIDEMIKKLSDNSKKKEMKKAKKELKMAEEKQDHLKVQKAQPSIINSMVLEDIIEDH